MHNKLQVAARVVNITFQRYIFFFFEEAKQEGTMHFHLLRTLLQLADETSPVPFSCCYVMARMPGMDGHPRMSSAI